MEKMSQFMSQVLSYLSISCVTFTVLCMASVCKRERCSAAHTFLLEVQCCIYIPIDASMKTEGAGGERLYRMCEDDHDTKKFAGATLWLEAM